MAIPTATLEILNYSIDTQQDFNIKLILYIYMLGLAIVSFWYINHMDRKDAWDDMKFYMLSIFSWTSIAFIPLYIFTLVRSVPLSTVLMFVIAGYSVSLSPGILYYISWLGKSFLEKYFGVKFDDTTTGHRTEREYRRVEQ